jgi:hypothetical protein
MTPSAAPEPVERGGAPVARNGKPCDCETPGDWHRVANDFQRAMFEERERAERAEKRIAELEVAVREDTERPDGDSHWASVVIDGAFEPRELTEAEAEMLYESGLDIGVERMWIRPGMRKHPTATNEETGEVTPYDEALPPLQDSKRPKGEQWKRGQ